MSYGERFLSLIVKILFFEYIDDISGELSSNS